MRGAWRAAMRRIASDKGRSRCRGRGHPKGRLAAGSCVVIGLERCHASPFALFLACARLQGDEIAR
ncbi:MAG: hypothetical protein OET79_09645 [Nitrospirota bacterium]|nr:hypothetical protein [Nitrospirota bacterium]